jgi:hypothetical protein
VQDVPHRTNRPSLLPSNGPSFMVPSPWLNDETLDHLRLYRCSSPWHVSYGPCTAWRFFTHVSSTAIQHQTVSQAWSRSVSASINASSAMTGFWYGSQAMTELGLLRDKRLRFVERTTRWI